MFDGDLTVLGSVVLVISLGIAFGFEFINGFHDTANAVATVIYTKSLRPMPAVIWSGLWNFLGVLLGGVAVAYAIVHLLPVELLVEMNQASGLAMVLSVLLSAVIWNFATWYRGLPASSSHTLIGSILGVGLASALQRGEGLTAGVNWGKAVAVVQSLLVSPIVGFCLAGALLLGALRFIKIPAIHEPPVGDAPPPVWIRAILILTCTGVSFAHGSNDGQKGIGLIMLILIGLLPGVYALNLEHDATLLKDARSSIDQIEEIIRNHQDAPPESIQSSSRLRQRDRRSSVTDMDHSWDHVKLTPHPIPALPGPIIEHLEIVRSQLVKVDALDQIPKQDRWPLRVEMLQLRQALIEYRDGMHGFLSPSEHQTFTAAQQNLMQLTEYAPTWVLVGVAVALGVGTTVGWKRIVVTVGEKIGKTHLTYAQGACAELVAMTTIGAADVMGLPVSTTHVLSSGVAGTMAANKSGLQMSTVRSIVAAWVLTLPVAMLLSAVLFWLSSLVISS